MLSSHDSTQGASRVGRTDNGPPDRQADEPVRGNSSVQRPIFMPETFTGMGRDWSDWSEQFEMAAGVNQWGGELKLKFMSLLFSGRARDIYIYIYAGLSPVDKSSYEQ